MWNTLTTNLGEIISDARKVHVHVHVHVHIRSGGGSAAVQVVLPG